MPRRLCLAALLVLAACSPPKDNPVTEAASGAASAVASHLDTSTEPAHMLGGVDLSQSISMVGTEPFWNILFGGGRVVFSSPDSNEGRTTTEPFFFGPKGAEWHGEGMDIYLTAGRCSDGMSDRSYRLKAEVHIGDTKLKGCADQSSVLQMTQP